MEEEIKEEKLESIKEDTKKEIDKTNNKDIKSMEKDIIMYELEQRAKYKTMKIIGMPQYDRICSAIRMMTQKHKTLHGVLINSRPGIGKSMTTKIVLNQHNADYIIINNHLTKKELFILLQNNKDKIVVIDDVDKILENSDHASILKQALDTHPYGREIQYNTSTKIKDDEGNKLIKKFIFTGKIIILTNKVKDDEHINAIKDRVLYHKINMTNQDLFEIMQWIVKNPLPNSTDLSLNERQEVFDFIKEKMGERANLTLRTLSHGYEFKTDCIINNENDSWKPRLLEEEKELDTVLIAGKIHSDENFNTKEEKATEFNRLTNLGVAEYYRNLKEFVAIYKTN